MLILDESGWTEAFEATGKLMFRVDTNSGDNLQQLEFSVRHDIVTGQ